MITALRLAIADFRARLSLLFAAIVLVATPLSGSMLLNGFARGMDLDFARDTGTDLIVQESNSVGEITGSRIAAITEGVLVGSGVAFAIPEIHAVAGSSAENAVLIRGVDLLRYRSIVTFEIAAGRPLGPEDGPTNIMVGA